MKSMNDLFLNFVQDIFYAEKQIVKSLPKLTKNAESQELKDAFQKHRGESQHHVERLEQVFDLLGKRHRGKTCAAMNGLIEECEEAISDGEKGKVLDAALIACAQAIEHYEIARYGALVAWAKAMGMNEAADLLHATLQEEKTTDQRLTEIADTELAKHAAEPGADELDDEKGSKSKSHAEK